MLDGFTITGGNANGDKPNYWGGGIDNGGTPTLSNLIITGNSAYWGGGMWCLGEYPSITNITFINNTATGAGGGMFSGGKLILTNATFIGNTSALEGGGLATVGNVTTLINTTFIGNTATLEGSAIDNYSPSTLTMRNSIVWGNNTLSGGPQVLNYSMGTIAFSDIQGGCPYGLACSDMIEADPQLGSLGYYGGLTQVLPLLPGSPAIDAGDEATCAATDQRSISRPQGAGCDMGAFESRGFTLEVMVGDDQGAPSGTAFAQPLILSVSSAFGEPVNNGVVIFTVPASGVSAILSSNMATIVSGTTSVTATANAGNGRYTVIANTAGATSPAAFHLDNQAYRTFLPLIASDGS